SPPMSNGLSHGSSPVSPDVVHHPRSDAVGVFLVEVLPIDSIELAQSPVLSGLDPGVGLAVVHAVGLEEDHGTEVGTVGEEVAGPEVGLVADGLGVAAAVGEGGEAGFVPHGPGQFVAQSEL